ncbi:MAG: DUF58 domain-containing protein [Lachnospiraceae bacterium]|nr:DUF58 domain-containing protein [Lachnospiraceae bacterium]
MENIIRTIGYALLFIINALLFYFLHSHFTFIVMVLMIVAPIISIVLALVVRRFVTVNISNTDKSYHFGRQHEEAFFEIKVNNPTPFVCLEAKLKVKIKNTFFKTEGERIIDMPLHAFKGYTLELPIIPTLPGIVSIEVASLTIKDLMGFKYFKKNIEVSNELVVMPCLVNENLSKLPEFEQGMLESEESSKKGNDFSDVHDIREYIPGDKLMSIHWKLSAKRDILMVKDRVSMSDRQMVILPELCGENNYLLEGVLAATYAIITSLIKDKTTVRLMYWSSKRYEYENIKLDYKEELDEAFAKMFYEDTYVGYDEASINMASVNPELKAYAHVYGDGGRVVVTIRENV